MRVLVTGGDGFIGQNTVFALRQAGHSVLIAGRRKPVQKPSGYTVDLLNKSDRALLVKQANADALVHLAWETTPGSFWDAPVNIDWVSASYDLIQRFLDAGGTRAVVAGSCAEYDWGTAQDSLTETAPCRPSSIYGSCKLDLCRRCDQLRESGASIAWGRLFFLLGPGEHPSRFIPSIIQPLLAGQTADMSEGVQIRDFLHVLDAGQAFAKLVNTPLNGIVNVASGIGVSLSDLAQAAHNRIGRGNLRRGAVPMRRGDPPRLVADVQCLRDKLSFEGSLDWRSALDTCIEYWRGAPHKYSNHPPP